MAVDIYLAGGARTAIGAFMGCFAQTPATRLGSESVKASLLRAGIKPSDVDEVIFGNVVSAGLGQNVARQVSIGAGIPASVGATSVNKVCGSGLKAVMLAAQAIACGDAGVVVAGGTENMSRAPFLLDKARSGYRLGNAELIDAMIRDGLWDAYADVHMGACGELCASRYDFSRERQDAFAIESFRRAIAASSAGAFKDEIVPVEIGGKSPTLAQTDENLGKFDEAKLRRLSPVFKPDGTITAGNASSINDGAASIVVLSTARARELGVTPSARILGYSTAAGDPSWFTTAPVAAITRLLERIGRRVEEIDLFEINEAFAVVPLVAMRELGIRHDKLNVNGGAIALGHPIGASGARTLVTLLGAMRARSATIGVNALCLGGGEAVAMAVELL